MNLLAGAKTQSNPENCVGVLSLAGNVPKMLVTPTPELGKILNCLQVVQIDGSIHFGTGVQARSPGRKTSCVEGISRLRAQWLTSFAVAGGPARPEA